MRDVGRNSGAPREFIRQTLAITSDASTAERVRNLLLSNKLDWEKVAAVAAAERVAPALFPILRDSQTLSFMPADFQSFLEAVNDLNRIRNLQLIAETELISKLLNSRGIEPVLLKGLAYLMSGVYTDVGSRFLIDIDMLVSNEELPESIQILQRAGFQPRNALDPVHHHYSAISRAPETPVLELHKHFTTKGRTSVLQPQDVIVNSKLVIRNGVRFRVPAPEHLVSHLILHAENDEGPRLWIWPALRPFLDFAMLVRAFGDELDWLHLKNTFDSAKSGYVFQLFCLTAKDVLDIRPPPGEPNKIVSLYRIRSRVLRKFPFLRFFDAGYLFSIAILPRLKRAGLILHIEGGFRHLIGRALRPGVLLDVIQEVMRRR